MITRFAPSPTGYIHIGNVRTALLSWLYARKSGGKFMLRIDDTDFERSKEEYVDALKEDLSWLGLNWDIEARQSGRMEAYREAIEKLKADERLYPCYETQIELDVKRKMQLGRGLPPIYDRAGLNLTEDQIAEFESNGRKPHYRFKLEDKNIAWEDEIRGEICFAGGHMSDPILIRETGAYTYMLPSTVDDIDFEITHVLRGEDHISNTAIQIQIFEALGGKIPVFGHNALIKTAEGKLSKRDGGNNVRSLREDEIEPMAVNSFLAKVGSSDPIDIRSSLNKLVSEFDINKFGKAPTIYSLDEITRLNTKFLHTLSFDEIKGRCDYIDEAFWLAVRPNIESLTEVKSWWKVCKEPLEPIIEDAEFTAKASKLLPEGVLTEDSWSIWISAIKEATGRRGKKLFMPIRLALTGMDYGPELKVLLPLIGREKVIARLMGKHFINIT